MKDMALRPGDHVPYDDPLVGAPAHDLLQLPRSPVSPPRPPPQPPARGSLEGCDGTNVRPGCRMVGQAGIRWASDGEVASLVVVQDWSRDLLLNLTKALFKIQIL